MTANFASPAVMRVRPVIQNAVANAEYPPVQSVRAVLAPEVHRAHDHVPVPGTVLGQNLLPDRDQDPHLARVQDQEADPSQNRDPEVGHDQCQGHDQSRAQDLGRRQGPNRDRDPNHVQDQSPVQDPSQFRDRNHGRGLDRDRNQGQSRLHALNPGLGQSLNRVLDLNHLQDQSLDRDQNRLLDLGQGQIKSSHSGLFFVYTFIYKTGL